MLDRSVKMFQLIISELLDDVFEELDTRLVRRESF
jgi:hypothetical protein